MYLFFATYIIQYILNILCYKMKLIYLLRSRDSTHIKKIQDIVLIYVGEIA